MVLRDGEAPPRQLYLFLLIETVQGSAGATSVYGLGWLVSACG